MKICIDARSPGYSGVLNYASNLLRTLLTIDKKNQYIILSAPKDKHWNLDGVEERVIPSNNPLSWLIWSNTVLPKMLEREQVDVYHSLKHVTAFRGKTKKIITFHSARFFFLPQHYKWYDATHWKIMYPAAARKYDCVITVSEAEKENYVEYIRGVAENKFRVINLAADERFRIIDDSDKLQETKKKFSLPDKFLLFVGRLLPVKNIETILKAYHMAKQKIKLEHKLVIVGRKTWFYKEILSLVKELDIIDDVIFTGPIFSELPEVYNLADLFLFPSYYEAFPAVPLEAMACGTPVISADSGGLPDVVGNAGIMVSPTNVNALAEAVIQVITSEGLKQSMINKGLQRIGVFSWERCAQETLKIYDEFA
ncbi:MAG: glycosyltransferase family 4 protein [Waddliaceae bacterium]